jgi:hypothetical protein
LKDQWYGDNRDLVKWGVLLRLAAIYRAGKIIQVAYSRPSHWDALDIDGKSHPLPRPVIEHFRDIRNIVRLTTDPEIQVVVSAFSNRPAYSEEVLEIVAEPSGPARIVFLDPDTGLAPRKPDLAHVLDEEVTDIWKSMRKGDVLVFYQHQTNRNGKPWIEPKREQFERAIGQARGTAKVAHAPAIARDVVFFYARKNLTRRSGTA